MIIFHKLSFEDASEICEKIIGGLKKRIDGKGIGLVVSARAKSKLVEDGYSEEFGARPLKRVVQKQLEDRLSEEILLGNVKAGQTVVVDVINEKLTFTAE